MSKEISSDENDGGARDDGKKRKVESCLENVPEPRPVKSRRKMMNGAEYTVLHQSRTLSPNFWGTKSTSGREPGTKRTTMVGIKNGETSQGIRNDGKRRNETKRDQEIV